MLDEEMDHIIRDAAESHHPPYNDKAWEKMEQLLDKHLPQKKDNRKYFFFLLLFLLLGGGALYSIYQFSQGDKKPIATAQEKQIPAAQVSVSTAAPANEEAGSTGTETSDQRSSSSTGTASTGSVTPTAVTPAGAGKSEPASIPALVTTTAAPEAASGTKQPAAGNQHSGKEAVWAKRSTKSGKARSAMRITAPAGTDDTDEQRNSGIAGRNRRQTTKGKSGKTTTSITPASPAVDESMTVAGNPEETPKTVAVSTTNDAVNKPEPATEAEKKKEEPEVKAEEKAEKKPETPIASNTASQAKKKPANKFGNNFAITVSAGPDVSFVSFNKLGKATLLYGAGISYTFAKQRLTVRTGFYLSKKIYDASPDQYHSPGGNYPNLYNVAADCKIYEIPIGLNYNFGARRKHSWFGAAGISSYLMKTEKYDYQYKTASGYTYNYKHSVSNENNHYFSVVTLSAGYQYKLSRRVSLQAEPYVKLPLGGVGEGKVKLNSGGILFTATIRPFAKKE